MAHVLLVVTLYIIHELTSACDVMTNCPGNRERTGGGCCPLPAGHVCGAAIQGDCDDELGYTCKEGICAGRSNLTASNVGASIATLSWTAFLPAGNQYEYSVLYTTSLREPVQEWNSHGVGNNVNVTLRDLTPATWYFVRIGVWIARQYTNLTETVIFQTKAEDYCLYNGRRISVGEHLVVECEDSCICMPTGQFACVPVCRKQNMDSPACTGDWSDGLCCDMILQCSYENCTYLGEFVQHEQTWLIDCEENCTCYDGVVMCTPHCEKYNKNETCSNPTQRKSDDGCCDVWDCVNKNGDPCTGDNMTQSSDSWVFSEDCELCTCFEKSRDCIRLNSCGDEDLPEVSETCRQPKVVENLCCKQVVCQNGSELDDIIEVLTIAKFSISSIAIRFKFTSPEDEANMYQFIVFFTKDPAVVDYNSWQNVTLLFSDALDANKNNVRYMDFGKENQLYYIDGTFIFVSTNLKVNAFYYIKLRFEFPSNTADKPVITSFVSDIMVTKIPGVQGTIPTKTDSITKSNSEMFSFQVSNILSSSVLLTWNISEYKKYDISSYVIKYKTFSDTDWQFTERFIFSDNFHLLACLVHSRWYEAQLVAYPASVLLGTIIFNTSTLIESSDEPFSTNIHDVEIADSSVTVNWNQIPDDQRFAVQNLEIIWTSGIQNGNNPIWKVCSDASTKTYKLDNLNPGEMYIVWIGVYFKSGKTFYSNRIHFVTSKALGSAHSSANASTVVAIAISCISVVAMVIAIVTVLYITRFRRRSSYQTHTSFENRIFQIYKQREEDPDL